MHAYETRPWAHTRYARPSRPLTWSNESRFHHFDIRLRYLHLPRFSRVFTSCQTHQHCICTLSIISEHPRHSSRVLFGDFLQILTISNPASEWPNEGYFHDIALLVYRPYLGGDRYEVIRGLSYLLFSSCPLDITIAHR